MTTNHTLILDYGNTLKKLAVFEDNTLLVLHKTQGHIAPLVENIAHTFPHIRHAILGSVAAIPQRELTLLQQHYQLLVFDQHTPLPFSNQYGSPQSLGLDRLANVAGALLHFPGHDMLIVDIGSCITYDIVDKEARYWGGAISPGMRLRAQAMHHFTHQLPLVEVPKETLRIGNDTISCMQSGIVHGTSAEISGMIDGYLADYKDLKVLFSGGDAHYFENRVKYHIFAAPNLVLEGLHNILRYNED